MNTTPDVRIGHIIAEETVQTVLLIIVSVVATWLCLYKMPWQVSGDPCLVAAAATVVIVACLWPTRWRGLSAVNFERHLLAGFLAAMPLVYLTRYLSASAGQGTNSSFWVEALGVLVFAALALLGAKLSPWSSHWNSGAWISLGYLALPQLDLHTGLVRNCLPGGGPRLWSLCGDAYSHISEDTAYWDGDLRHRVILGTKEHEMHHRAQLTVIEPLLGSVPYLTRNRQAARCGNTPRFLNLEAKEAKVAMRKLVSSKSPLEPRIGF